MAKHTPERLLLAAYRQLTKTDVLVGFPAGEGPREDGSPITNAVLAYIQTQGDPEHNLPARPFLAPGIEAARDQVTAQLAKAGRAMARGDAQGVRNAQEAAGTVAVASVKNYITAGIDPPLSPATLAERKRAGFKGETPLVRSGQLRNGVVWVIAPRSRA